MRFPATFVAFALTTAACRESHEHEPEGDHDHASELKTVQVTLWQGRLELFLEHRVLVVGEAVRFAAHVSDLEKGEPRRSGPVTFHFELTPATRIDVTVPAPARPGIYTPEVTFPSSGRWKGTLVVPLDGRDHVLALPELTVFATAEEAAHAKLPEPPTGIAFLKEQQWMLKTRAEPVARRRLVEEVRVPATIAAPPAARAHVTPPLAGRLSAATRPWPQLGTRVEQGETLAFVEPPLAELIVAVAQADAEVAQARLAVDQAEATLRRVRTLAEQKARTQRELEEAEFSARGAAARLDAALAVTAAWRRTGLVPESADPGASPGAALPRLPLTAPIAGVITRVDAVAGESVGADASVFTILDERVVHVEARVPEVDLARLGEPLEAAFTVPGSDAPPAPITGAGGGKLAWRDVEIDAATRTLTLHFELPDPGRQLAIGQSLVAHLTTKIAADALALPESAIVDEDARPVAFVQVGGETFEKRELALGIRDRGWVEVRQGVTEGERVVVDGAYAVRLAAASTTIPSHGHAH